MEECSFFLGHRCNDFQQPWKYARKIPCASKSAQIFLMYYLAHCFRWQMLTDDRWVHANTINVVNVQYEIDIATFLSTLDTLMLECFGKCCQGNKDQCSSLESSSRKETLVMKNYSFPINSVKKKFLAGNNSIVRVRTSTQTFHWAVVFIASGHASWKMLI